MQLSEGTIMSKGKYFVERRSEGDYAVRKEKSDRASVVLPTQKEAIDWSRERGINPHVERVRHTERGNPDKWRKT
jgi:Uncharacterized protein conserved in bacteria (DUF2188)